MFFTIGFYVSLVQGIVVLSSIEHEVGGFSHYAPGDGQNGGELACGGEFTQDQVHIAYRRWRKRGCGSYVVVYSEDTGQVALTTIQDGGPYGIYTGPLKRAKREGRWRVHTRYQLPEGWKWRGLIDASHGLWKVLGKPKFLTRVHLWHVPGWLVAPLRRSRVFLSI